MVNHPLDDDGFVEKAINELTEITNKWNLVIESDNDGNVCLVYRCKVWNLEERYVFKYDCQNRKYV